MYITEFEHWLREEGVSLRTVSIYRRIIQSLIRWYEERTGEAFAPSEVTSLDLHDWRAYMQTVKKLKPASVNQNLAAAKTYWTFLVETERAERDPTQKVKMKFQNNNAVAPRSLSRREKKRFLEMIETEKSPFRQARNLAMAQVMLQAGLRREEVASLDLSDLDLSRRRYESLTVRHGKGGRFRIVPVNTDLRTAFITWLEERERWLKSKGIDNEPALFLSERPRRKGTWRITHNGVYQALKKYLIMANLSHVRLHDLRHTAGKAMLDAGYDVTWVARVLGHTNIQTTERYVAPTAEDLRRMAESISEEKE